MEFLAPAKVNLSLRVLGQREDGYHEIETRLVPISIFDKLEITHRETGGLEFVCSDMEVPRDDSNLVVRAVRLFCGSLGLMPNLRVTLAKQIPVGAGLGGGSSDAAAALLDLDRLFETHLPRETLVEMAAALGSDVPFFLYQSAAICRGRGDLVTPAPFPCSLPLLLIKPPFAVATPCAYQRWRDSVEIPGAPYAPQTFTWGELRNDLERPVFEKYVFLASLKRWLLDQPEVEGALLSGSGSTTFAVLREEAGAFSLGERLAGEFGTNLWCFACRTIVPSAPKPNVSS